MGQQVITNWNLMLEDGDINAHQPSELKAIIRENLTIRDSIIIASTNPSISVDELTTLAADAHTASKKRELNNLIDDAYSTGAYDHERAAKAISLLDQLAAGNDAHSAQPNAISAWLEWLNENTDNAQAHTIAALESDEECTLACIAYAAINYGIRPAYLD